MEFKLMPSLTRRLLLASALVASLAAPAVAADKKTMIVAEPVHGTGYLPLYVAIHKGFFSDLGLDVKILTVESGAGHTNAVLSGQAFAFIGGPEHDAFAKAKGAELRAVVNVVDRGNVYYVAAKGKEPKPGQTLGEYFKGKNIAVGFFGGTPNSITRYYLKQWGLDAKTDVTLLETTTAAIMAAVKTGKADIGVLTEPQITQGIKESMWAEPILNVPKDLGDYAYSTLNVRLASIKEDPDGVRKFVEGVTKGLTYTYAHPDEAAAIAKLEFPTMAPDDLKATLDRSFADELWSKDGNISRKAWDTAHKVVRSADILKQDVAYDDIIDMQFLPRTKAEK
jgi:NitT/TauT family transport system substrate-binding protein